MTIELRPLGVKCNLACEYCYQEPQRDGGNVRNSYSVEKMLAKALELKGAFSLFGGEPLLVPLGDLAEIFRAGFDRHGRNGIQTNGTLITEEHVRMFELYNVGVGFSIDGPEELNSLRVSPNASATGQMTNTSIYWLERLTKEKRLRTSLIVTIHRQNASAERLPRLVDWLRHLDAMGLESARVHVLESENEDIRQRHGLTIEENVGAFRALAALEAELAHLRFDLFRDIRRLLLGDDQNVTCVWNACDPLSTAAVQGIESDGSLSNCGRTNKEGVDWVKSSRVGYERTLALATTPQSVGGCRDCRWLAFCRGQCPGTGIDGDWRNRSELCGLWKVLFEDEEHRLIEEGNTPLSDAIDLRLQIEELLVDGWERGRNRTIREVLREVRGGRDGGA